MGIVLVALLIFIFLSSVSVGSVAPGVSTSTPPGYVASNFDPNLNSSANNQIYDPNFIPGFQAGLTNTSIYWSSGIGHGQVGYWVGPWLHDEDGIPHFAVGPQCCNFVEVPHTQQFRQPSWGDYYSVKAGFGPPGVNVQNFTSDFKAPADVGLRTDWNWTVQFALDWASPSLLNSGNQWAAIGIAVTQYVPGANGNLVYSVMDFWMDQNSSSKITTFSDGVGRAVEPNVVVYHPLQLSTPGNQTVTLNISRYLVDTLKTLGLTSPDHPPVISYVYLNIEGYNFRWNTTLWSFRVVAQNMSGSGVSLPVYVVVGAVATIVIVMTAYRVIHARDLSRAQSPSPQSEVD